MNQTAPYRLMGILFILALLVCAQRAQAWSFAVLTDLHISSSSTNSSTDSSSLASLRAAVEQINTDSCAFVLVLGDISHHGTIDELRLAKNEMDCLRVPYYITSGNHDLRHSPLAKQVFDSLFSASRFAFVYGEMRMVGVNSAVVGERVPYGQITDSDQVWLSEQLLDSLPTILATHYPCDSTFLHQSPEWCKMLQKRGVMLILSGHAHRNLLFSVGALPNAICRGLQPYDNKPAAYTRIQVDKDAIHIIECPLAAPPYEWLELPRK